MKDQSRHSQKSFWPKIVVRKWLNISTKDSDFSADTEDEDECDSGSDAEDICKQRTRHPKFGGNRNEDILLDNRGTEEAPPRSRRRKSETFRAQYIDTRELKIFAGTWNVGGKLPPNDLHLDDWLDVSNPSDIYVLGFQEVVPLNAGNIFGAEDNRPVPRWEKIIRETLNKVQHVKTSYKCQSDPSSPSRFKPSDDVVLVDDEFLVDTDSDRDGEVYPLDEEYDDIVELKDKLPSDDKMLANSGVSGSYEGSNVGFPINNDLERLCSYPKRLNRLNCLRTENSDENVEASVQPKSILTTTHSGKERVELGCPEPHLNLGRPMAVKSFKASKSLGRYNSFKSFTRDDHREQSLMSMLAEIDLKSLMKRKRTSYVRIVSKQMVGIFLTIWVRRSLRRHIQNLRVSTVGVGVMGYIGNKGSVSVSLSIYQTFFCFVCSHLTSGEKDGDENKRNADVHEINRRTHFRSFSNIGPPQSIDDHEKIIWLGDLNYRIKLSYEKALELIYKKEWSKLIEMDQLVRELRKGRAFDGWSEGTLNFSPTYKYEYNSEKYVGEDPKTGRRTPAWCDRILSYGKGMKLLSYGRTELKLSDHRPVSASYMVVVEELCSRKLQRALTFTDAEIENEEFDADIGAFMLA